MKVVLYAMTPQRVKLRPSSDRQPLYVPSFVETPTYTSEPILSPLYLRLSLFSSTPRMLQDLADGDSLLDITV
jgi:hypothetical protein